MNLLPDPFFYKIVAKDHLTAIDVASWLELPQKRWSYVKWNQIRGGSSIGFYRPLIRIVLEAGWYIPERDRNPEMHAVDNFLRLWETREPGSIRVVDLHRIWIGQED